MPEHEALGYDADDMFGVRRALEILPASSWEQFLFEWRSLTEVADFDVDALNVAIRRQARRRSRYEGSNDPIAAAWSIVADATARYVRSRSDALAATFAPEVGERAPMDRAS